jgi:hypothetical protein
MSRLAGCALLVRPNALAAFRAPKISGGLDPTDLKRSLDVDLLTAQYTRRRFRHLRLRITRPPTNLPEVPGDSASPSRSCQPESDPGFKDSVPVRVQFARQSATTSLQPGPLGSKRLRGERQRTRTDILPKHPGGPANGFVVGLRRSAWHTLLGGMA